MSEALFVSLDVETLGPIPGKHAMVQLGAACFNIDGMVVNSWQGSLSKDVWGSHSSTMEWWRLPKNIRTFQKIEKDARPPGETMRAFHTWLVKLPGRPTPVAYPAAFDYMFVYWYMMYYVGTAYPFSFSCLDVKTYAMAALKKQQFHQSFKKKFPRAWFHPKLKHTHNALDDAIEQGWMFIQAHRENLGLPLLDAGALKIV